jgi:hypothetical protein
MRRTLAIVIGISLLRVARAIACGCFAPPTPATPVVQAGERILFARQDGVITAHIQIQYAGDADDFGWLLPLPSLPELALGSDELFTQLQRTTQPSYTVQYVYEDCGGGSSGYSCFGGGTSSNDAFPGAPGTGPGPVVLQGSIGPYDSAVLRADSKDEMLAWLAANHYFVPAGTDAAVAPYIHPGGYFLALKLHQGQSVQAIQPVIVKYPSDLPMIPIILTSVAAQPDMGIQVWVLGAARAIPRNYAHTILDDAQLDWINGARNYNDVVVRATQEASGRHTFVTEYAGPSQIMVGVLDAPGRFGSQVELAAQPSYGAFVSYLDAHGYRVGGAYPSPLQAILAQGAPPAAYQPDQMAADVFARVVAPALAAGALFRAHPYLTRLYTTLSPEQMDRDPVFSENGKLPPVSNQHSAQLVLHCNGDRAGSRTPATLVTEQGHFIPYLNGTQAASPTFVVPASQRIETLSEEGAPVIVADNGAAIDDVLGKLPQPATGGGGCGVTHRRSVGAATLLALIVLVRLAGRRRAVT